MKLGQITRSLLCSLALTGPTAGYSDDTDIFMQTSSGNTAEPLVMLTLDMRPNNLNSGGCSVGADCASVLGTKINNKLNQVNTDWGLGLTTLTRFDVIRVVFATLIDELKGVKVGLMVSHNDDGGYVLRGFRSLKANDTNHAKEELMRKLFSLPSPGGTAPSGGSGSSTPGGTGTASACVQSVSGDKTMTAFGMTWDITTDAIVYEGTSAVFTVTASGSNTSGANQTLNYATSNGGATGVNSATAGSDYTTVNNTDTTNKNKSPSTFTITVPTTGDLSSEQQEDFKVTLSIAGSADTAVGYASICDVNAGFSVDDPATVNEGTASVFTVTRYGPTTAAASVQYATANGTATAGSDYTAKALTTLNFAIGEKTKTVSVTTLTGGIASVPENFYLNLSNASAGNTILDNQGIGSIKKLIVCESSVIGSNQAHKYQGAELYFELFRYLTGGPIKYAHLGDSDFTGPSNKNLDAECYQPGLNGTDENATNNNLDPNGGIDAVLQWDVGGRPTSVTGGETDPLVESGGNYVSPLGTDSECAGTYAIDFLFGVSQQDNGANTDINKSRAQYGTGTVAEGGANAGNSNAFADMIKFFNTQDLAASSFPNWSSSTPPAGKQNLVTYMLRLGGPPGQFSAYSDAGAIVLDAESASAEQLLAQLEEIFRQILSQSSSFVSASVPVNVFNRVETSDDVYIALFNVDETFKPVWPGNVKKLKFGFDSGGNLILHDANSSTASAINPLQPGRIKFDALTYWTQKNALPAPGSTYDIDVGDEQAYKVNLADGPFASRGASGHRIPGFTVSTVSAAPGNPGMLNSDNMRKLYTDPTSGTTLTGLDANDATATALQSALGATSQAAAKDLICYARGISNCTAVIAAAPVTTPTARSWIMADALHSRPLTLNYGARSGFSSKNQDVRIMFGTNDGFFHMVQNTAASTTCGDTNGNGSIGVGETACTESGVENWAFMPRTVMPIVSLQKTNATMTQDLNGDSFYRPYGVDGVPAVIVNPGADGVTIGCPSVSPPADCATDYAWVYFGLRRGGSGYYGLDISNPDSPSMLWKITSATAGFEELALSFSTPAPATVQYGSSSKKVLIFGGGYYGGWIDTNADGAPDTRVGYDKYDNSTAPDLSATTHRGNAIYIVDAQTGELLWKAQDSGSSGTNGGTATVYSANTGLDHSISAEVTPVDSDNDKIIDRAYVADMGGNVWRIDLPRNANAFVADNRNTWKITKLAALGDVGANGGSDDRRFQQKIDVVLATDPSSNNSVDALLLGSGDREHPKVNTVNNYFFMIKDPNFSAIPSSESPFTIADLANADCFLPSGAPSSGCSDATTLVAHGWKLALTATGEKVVTKSLTAAGEVRFASYLPEGGSSSGACATVKLGAGRTYTIGVFTGAPTRNRNAADDNGNTSPTTASDRYNDQSQVQGMPSDSQYLSHGRVMDQPGSIETVNLNNYYRTYWYEKDIDN